MKVLEGVYPEGQSSKKLVVFLDSLRFPDLWSHWTLAKSSIFCRSQLDVFRSFSGYDLSGELPHNDAAAGGCLPLRAGFGWCGTVSVYVLMSCTTRPSPLALHVCGEQSFGTNFNIG